MSTPSFLVYVPTVESPFDRRIVRQSSGRFLPTRIPASAAAEDETSVNQVLNSFRPGRCDAAAPSDTVIRARRLDDRFTPTCTASSGSPQGARAVRAGRLVWPSERLPPRPAAAAAACRRPTGD